MATSTEKLLDFLQQLDDQDDDALAQMLPIPPGLARMAIAGASTRIPDDHEQLDEWALAAARFCLDARSDDAPRFVVAIELPDGQLAPAAVVVDAEDVAT